MADNGYCPVCGRSVTLRPDGRCRTHRFSPTSGSPCQGEFKLPVSADQRPTGPRTNEYVKPMSAALRPSPKLQASSGSARYVVKPSGFPSKPFLVWDTAGDQSCGAYEDRA